MLPLIVVLSRLVKALTTWQNAMAFSIPPTQLHNYRDTTRQGVRHILSPGREDRNLSSLRKSLTLDRRSTTLSNLLKQPRRRARLSPGV
jgi:hypothetical protein